MLRAILSTTFWVFLVLSSLACFPVAVAIWALTAPFDRRRRALHLFTCFWASLYSWLNPAWTVSVAGRERIRRGETYVMIANHQSLADILVLFRLFRHFKWVSKAEIFRVPCIGWNMYLNQYVQLRRGDRESVRQMMRTCEQRLAEGSSIMIFPEGTRSLDGHLRPFKTGAFTLAKRTRRPLLPILIEGSGAALPKRGFILQGKHEIRIRILDEIPPPTFGDLSDEALAERTRALFQRELEKPATAPADALDHAS